MDRKSDRPVGIYIPKGRRQIDKTKDQQNFKDRDSSDIKLLGLAASINTNNDNIDINKMNGNNNIIPVISSDDDKSVKSNKSLVVTNKIDLINPSNDSVNSINTNNIVPITKSERPVGIYIPKGRRMLETQKVSNCFQKELIDEEKQNNNINKNSSLENTISWIERFEKVDRVSDYKPTVVEIEPICYETSIPITDEIILDSCLIITNVSSETSEVVKNNLCLPYQNAGGIIKWIYPQECLIIFKNEKAVLAATTKISINNHSTFKVQRLKNSNTLHIDEYIKVSRPILQSIMKPERDSRVANRLIGAALGIRLPNKTTKTNNNNNNNNNNTNSISVHQSYSSDSQQPVTLKQRTKSPPKIDAWDD